MSSTITSALHWRCVPNLDATKPTLIFLHAAWMSSPMFEETTEYLSSILSNTNLLCVDVNGHGKTVDGRETFTLWDQADDIVTLMDQLGIKTAIFIGISMGALITMRLALSHPSRITALCLISSTATAETPDATAAITQVRNIWVSTVVPSEAIMDISIRGWGGEPDLAGTRAQQIKRHWVARHSGAKNIDAILKSIVERDEILGRLREITVPVLVVHGELDETWKVKEAEAIRDALVNAKVGLEIVKDSGHMVLWLRDSMDIAGMIGNFVGEIITSTVH
ncbi:Alpha/Beta hydrolase protein [Leptodontidium sp. MPI-SDFR-AT-0119]|nr:Alpha/Beta hydrolase protein [Leptodontidium sp. MPI-SDFR-AT-0119]